MSLVRGTGNKSTELRAEQFLIENNIVGWMKHPKGMMGKPDFYFPEHKLAVFIDGCFWHACPTCRRMPKSRTDFWHTKIDENRRRDNRVRRKLRNIGYRTMRVWEHELKRDSWIKRLRSRLNSTAKMDTLS
jgi:DNA mismatch endonuclease (patch repair protein)